MSVALAKETMLYGGSDIVLRVLSFLLFPLFAQVLSLDEFGVLALVTSVAALLAVLFNGTIGALQRYYWDCDAERVGRKKIVASGTLIVVATALLTIAIGFLLLYPNRAVIAERYQIGWSAIAMTLITLLPVHLTLYATSLLRLNFALWRYIALTAAYHLLTLGLTLLFTIGLRWGVTGYCFGTMLSAIAVLPFALIAVRENLSLIPSAAYLKRMFRFGYPFIIGGLAYWIFASIDRWMLVEMSSMEEVGLYSVAFKFATVLIFMINGFGRAWSPHAMRAFRDDPDYKGLYARALNGWYFFLVLVASGVSLFGADLLHLLFPPSYWPAASILPILASGIVFWGTVEIIGVGINLAERTGLFSWGAWISALLNVALNYLLIPPLGGAGAALATLGAYLFLTLFYTYWSQRLVPVPFQWRRLSILSLALFGTAAAGCWMANIEPTFLLFGLKLVWMMAVLVVGLMLRVVSWRSCLLVVRHVGERQV
jgi:O-antigen/teichoic acid export membrane protein